MSSSKWNFTSIASNFEADNQDEQGERHEREVQQGSGSQKRQHHPNDDFDPGNDSENNEIDNTDDDQTGPPFELLRQHLSTFNRFSKFDFVSEFKMRPTVRYPEGKLEDILNTQIRQAIQGAEKDGRKVEKLCPHLFGKGLNAPVSLNMRPIEQNSALTLMAELDRLSQSEGEENMDKRTLLLSHPIKLIVTCIAPPRGQGSRHFCRQFWGYDQKQRMRSLNTNNNWCLFYALCLAQRRHDQELIRKNLSGPESRMTKQRFSEFVRNPEAQKKEAIKLMNEAEINFEEHFFGLPHIQYIQNFWDGKFPGLYRIVAFEHAPESEVRPIWKAPPGNLLNVAIFLENGHWDGIRIINNFFQFGRNEKYCIDCESCYIGQGSCQKTEGFAVECEGCFRPFFNEMCFQRHKPRTCKMWKRCQKEDCGRAYLVDSKNPHDCASTYCKRCFVFHPQKRGCFIQKKKIAKKDYRICAFDCETTQDSTGYDNSTLVNEHQVNYISLRITCTVCSDKGEMDDCIICGPQRLLDWSEAEGHDPIPNFSEWLLTSFDKKYDTIVWSHNGGRPEPLMQGMKIYEFKVKNSPKHSCCIFRDSFLLWAIPLAQLPLTFGLNCQDKPFFPYLFNKKSNYNVRLDTLPDKCYYSPESMSEKKFEEFSKWHDENSDKMSFYLPDELRIYTRNDTEILMCALLAFRRLFMEHVTKGADVLLGGTTLAGVCMQVFKSMFLHDNEIAIVPERGYERSDTASVLAIKYFEYRALRDGLDIQHAGNGSEVRFNGKKLDAFIEEQNKAIEVLGCYYHVITKNLSAPNRAAPNRARRVVRAESCAPNCGAPAIYEPWTEVPFDGESVFQGPKPREEYV
uniref:DNA-directed DNA polymerase n=2 Tax=Globodera rostochiensis TaxID=31243 RepID=A0A914HC45_GLORO